MGKTKTLNWDTLKNIFFYNGTSRTLKYSLGRQEILNLGETMGLKKQEIFDGLKKTQLLNKLKDDDDK